jgi:adenylate cyclase
MVSSKSSPPLRSLTELARAGEEAGLPTGTVTFVATDLVDYSALVRSQDAHALAATMETYERAVREAVDAAGGKVFEWVGDSCIAVFRRAADAAVAGVNAQRRLREASWESVESPTMRVGMHTGEAARWRSGYVGLGLVRTLRVCDAAEPGQVVASPTTENVLSGIETPGVRFRALPERELDHFAGSVVLYELVANDDV